MKYICLGYYDKGKFDAMTESERNAMFDRCFEYDDHLRANGHWAGGEALQGPETALTLSWKNGKVATTDGPYAETKEQLGGILVLEARDMNHAVQLMAQSRFTHRGAASAASIRRRLARPWPAGAPRPAPRPGHGDANRPAGRAPAPECSRRVCHDAIRTRTGWRGRRPGRRCVHDGGDAGGVRPGLEGSRSREVRAVTAARVVTAPR